MACDLACRFHPQEDSLQIRTTYYKGYRLFRLTSNVNTCSIVVESVGEYQSGTGAKRSGRCKGQEGEEESVKRQ
jgi:hypothetical protein